MHGPRRPSPLRTLARTAPILLLAFGCGGGDDVEPSGLAPPDLQLEAHYTVSVDVLEVGPGCVIGGLTPSGELADAFPTQTGATVAWSQLGRSEAGRPWNLIGHICTPGEGYTIRLFGGRTLRIGDGDAVCEVNLALPDGHTSGRREPANRCEDPRCTTLELVSDGCGGWVADFEARLSYALGCAEQPNCIMRMRWHARPDAETDQTCTPNLEAGSGWMQDCRTLR